MKVRFGHLATGTSFLDRSRSPFQRADFSPHLFCAPDRDAPAAVGLRSSNIARFAPPSAPSAALAAAERRRKGQVQARRVDPAERSGPRRPSERAAGHGRDGCAGLDEAREDDGTSRWCAELGRCVRGGDGRTEDR